MVPRGLGRAIDAYLSRLFNVSKNYPELTPRRRTLFLPPGVHNEHASVQEL
jgi:hypothetical protein